MGRQSASSSSGSSSNHVVLLQYSSIALLQERFRQLQRAKRMRRLQLQKELFLRTTTSSSSDPDHRRFNNNNYESSKLFFQSEILSMIPQLGPAAHPEVSGLPLWPNVPDPADADRMKQQQQPAAAKFCGAEWSTPEIMKSSWPSADHHNLLHHPPSINFSESCNNSDVDTSLHL